MSELTAWEGGGGGGGVPATKTQTHSAIEVGRIHRPVLYYCSAEMSGSSVVNGSADAKTENENTSKNALHFHFD